MGAVAEDATREESADWLSDADDIFEITLVCFVICATVLRSLRAGHVRGANNEMGTMKERMRLRSHVANRLWRSVTDRVIGGRKKENPCVLFVPFSFSVLVLKFVFSSDST